MTDSVDDLLGTMLAGPVPGALAAMDGAVMGGLGALRERQASRRSLALAAAVAGFIGIGSGVMTTPPASAEPLLALPASAPSLLLSE